MDYVTGAKMIGSGLATIGLVGAGVGVGIVFGSLLISLSRNPQIEKSTATILNVLLELGGRTRQLSLATV
jgi:F0F1-type ATP synthase membrane subunit c/vacuolar-type H+-ATPase subunit K